MANHPLFSSDIAPVLPRHGKKGYVRLGVDINPDTRDRIIAHAYKDNVTMSAIVRDALDFYFDAVESV